MSATARSASTGPEQTEEEVLAELRAALRSKEPSVSEEPDDELVVAVGEFAQAVHAAGPDVEPGPEVLLRATRRGVSPDALDFLKAEQAYFVTPADLLDRCENLTRVGTIPA